MTTPLPPWQGYTEFVANPRGGLSNLVLPSVRVHLDFSEFFPVFANSTSLALSLWVRGSGGSLANPFGPPNRISLMNTYFVGGHTAGAPDAEHDPPANLAFDNSAGNTGGGVIRNNLNPEGDFTHPMNGGTIPTGTNCSWTHILWIADTNWAAGSKRGACAINGVPTGGAIAGDTLGATPIGFHGAPMFLNMNVGGYQPPCIADVAQMTLWSDTASAALLSGNGVFAPGAISKFITPGGKPVSFGAAGLGPFGVAPNIYLNGDKSTFATNLGTAGAGTIVGTAQRAFPYNYMFGPGATPDHPFEVFSVYDNGANFAWPAEGTGGPYAQIHSYGGPIAQDDYLLIFVKLNNNVAVTPGSRNILLDKGFGQLANLYVSTTTGGDFAIWSKRAVLADVTAAGAEWTNAPNITWTSQGVAFGSASYTLVNMRGVTNFAGVVAAATQVASSVGGGIVAPSVNLAGAKSTLLTGFAPWAINFEGAVSPPVSEDLLFFPNPNGSISALAWEFVEAGGPTGTRKWNTTAASGNAIASFSVGLQ